MYLNSCKNVWVEAFFQSKKSLVIGAVHRQLRHNLKDFTTAFQISRNKLKLFTRFAVLRNL